MNSRPGVCLQNRVLRHVLCAGPGRQQGERQASHLVGPQGENPVPPTCSNSLPVTSARRAHSWLSCTHRRASLAQVPSRGPPAAALRLTSRPTHGLCSSLSLSCLRLTWPFMLISRIFYSKLFTSTTSPSALLVWERLASLPAQLPPLPLWPLQGHLGSPPPTSCLRLEPPRSAVY